MSAVFYFRDPVLIVGDAAFNELYGVRRIFWKKAAAQARLFRPVKEVIIGENTGGDLISLAVKSAAKKPFCVLFPFRYTDGASYYAKESSGVPVVVLGSAEQKPPEETIFIQIDRETDFYRAGILSAILANFSSNNKEEEKSIAVFSPRSPSAELRAVLLKGAKERGVERLAEYFSPTAVYQEDKRTASAILLGRADSFLDRNPKIPVALFSWIDPALSPSAVKVVFDDSPWALLASAVRAAMKDKGGKLPSQVQILSDRIDSVDILKKLKNEVQNF